MKPTFFARRGLLILCVVFFLIPFALRGARMSLERMENNVKDWLPADFPETEVLTWFSQHFAGEQAFVLLTFEGCEEGDESYEQFVNKLRLEVRPQSDAEVEQAVADAPEHLQAKAMEVHRARTYGDQLGLHVDKEYYEDWGGLQEKWLLGGDGQTWYYITPDGKLYEWSGKQNMMQWMSRSISRAFGGKQVKGEHIATFGEAPGDGKHNDFHDNPERLTERMVLSVRTGPDILEEMAEQLQPKGGDKNADEMMDAGRALAMKRLKGWLFAEDEKQTCVVVTLTEDAVKDFRRVIGRGILGKPPGKLIKLADQSGIALPPPPPLTPWGVDQDPGGRVLRMGGPPVDNVAIDEEGQITLVRLIGFCAGIGLLLAYLSFRSAKVTLMIFVVGGVSAIASLGIVWWTGSSVDAILMSMPSLVYVLGISGAVHIINYYRDACQEYGPEGAAERALGHGWWPCSLAAFTTSLGLLSLYASNIIPIKKFGLYSALGVMATLFMLFLYLPSALALFPPGYRKRERHAPDSNSFTDLVTRAWGNVGQWILRRYAIVTVACLILMGTFAAGLFKIQTSVQLLELFDKNAKIIRDYTWLEDRIGKLVPMEVVVRFRKDTVVPTSITPLTDEEIRELEPKSAYRHRLIDGLGHERLLTDEEAQAIEAQIPYQYQMVDRMDIVQMVQSVIVDELGPNGTQQVGLGMSPATFVPEVPEPGAGSGLVTLRDLINDNLNLNRERILREPYMAIDEHGLGLAHDALEAPKTEEADAAYRQAWEDSELWRISIRIAALSDLNGDGDPDIDYSDFVSELQTVVEPVLKACQFADETLHKIVESRSQDEAQAGDEAQGALTLQGTKILVLGAANPSQADAEDRTNQSLDERLNHAFNKTLNRIFMSRDYRGHREAKQKLLWLDPASESFAKMDEQKFSRLLSVADAVVVVNDFDKYDLEFIQKHSKNVVDARDHLFDPSQLQAKTANQAQQPVDVVYTGVVPIVYKAQNTLLTSLIESTFGAFVLIMFVMMLLLGNWTNWNPLAKFNVVGGMFSMLPNVFPVVLIFGFMGHIGLKVDIGTMMTASVAMGVAVDDTIHFLNWFRTGIVQGLSRRDAILLAYQRCATAMTQTTLIGGLGLAVFAFSTFTPTQRFGTMMLALLMSALVGDLIFLPALLASPIGRFFCPKTTADNATESRKPNAADQDGTPQRTADLEMTAAKSASKTPHSERKSKHADRVSRRDDAH
ncbi:MAG: hypothetical protein CL681_24380 [Blastopirellula sp.]|nr:hypothetical protein [Blastopirellula sp.]